MPVKKQTLRKKPPAPEIVVLRDEVSQTNPLIQAKRNFTAIGTRIFFIGLQTLNPHFSSRDRFFDEKFPRVTIPPSQLVEIFGGNTAYLHELKKECTRLFNAIIEFSEADGGFELNHIFRELKYKPREGLHIQFDEIMRPYLLDLLRANGYTVISVAQIFKLSSTYAVRLVEIMLQYQNLPEMKARKEIERKMLMEELRFALNVKKGAYADRINNFRKFVLDEPIREINTKTLYKMRYEVQRDGKPGGRVIGFVLYMDVSAVKDDKPLIGSATATGKLRGLGFSEQAAEAILAKCEGEEDCLKRIASATRSLAMKKRRGGAVENELGYLRKYIEEDWQPRNKSTVKASNQPPPLSEVLAKEAKTPKRPALRRKGGPTSLGDIFRSTPLPESRKSPDREAVSTREPAADAFKGNEKPVPLSFRGLVASVIAQGQSSEDLKIFLEPFGLTVERFKELYM